MDRARIEKISKALGDETRLRIFEAISSCNEMNCGEIVSMRGVTPATVSHHLKILSEAGLIECRREGQFVYTLKGWVELAFEDGTKCRLEAGDSCFIPGGMRHNEIGTSDDLEILEVCLPADMGTVPVDPPAGRPNGS